MKNLQKICLLVIIIFCSTFLSGCWDNVELDEIFIATAMAIDATEIPDEFEVTLEIAKTGNVTSSASTKGGELYKNTIILKEKSKSLMEALEKLNFDSSRTIILQHSQVLLIGKEMAESGITKIMDFFLRERQPRLEVIMVMVDGNAGEILLMDPPQEDRSSTYVVGMIKDMANISSVYKIRILDFINDLLSKSKVSSMPVISKQIIENEEEIKLTGMAFFENGQLKAIKDQLASTGYFLAKDKVVGQIIKIEVEEGIVSFTIPKIKLKEKLELKDGKLSLTYNLFPVLQIAEVIGFGDYKFYEFLDYAEVLAENKIKEEILKNIEYFKELKIDALGYSTKIYKRSPKLWMQIKPDWDDIFENAEIKVEVKASIPSSGKSAESIAMEQKKNEYR